MQQLRLRAALVLGRLLVLAGQPRLRSTPRAATPPPDPERFAFYTFVTDEREYAEMRASFEAVGFDSFTRLSDADGDDPYRVIDRVGERDAYPILAHQDVRAHVGVEHLRAVVRELNALDPGWVVAGNAGVARGMRVVRGLEDPLGGGTGERLPLPVMSLDENVLVLNGHNRPRCTPSLRGFHFYGTDVCLNAWADGGSAWVVDLPVTHLSGGDSRRSDAGAYDECRERLLATARCRFRYVGTPTGVVFLSRHGRLRSLFGSRRLTDWVELHRRTAHDDWRAR